MLAFASYSTPQSFGENKISFMYLYGGTTTTYIQQIEKTNNSINIISPNYFELDDLGNLQVKADPQLVKYAHERNIKIVPFLSNHWNREKAQMALKNQENLVKNLVAAVKKYNFDGINIDLENLAYEDREQLTNLMRLLKENLQSLDCSVSIAVGAIDKPTTLGWKSAFDLKELSNYADFLIIMAYDEHWTNSKPGPIASLPWVKKNIEYMLKSIPQDKFVLGIPFYGRVWTDGSNGGGITYPNIIQALEVNNGEVFWNENFQSPYAKYTKNTGETKEIWFENAQSLKQKLYLVNTYNLRGAAAWCLGQEDTSIWSDFSTWLNGSLFKDITKHWAQKDITYLTNQGIIKGRDSDNFAPDASITRAETVTLLARIFSWDNELNNNPFIDVPPDYWAIKPILGAYNHNIVRGTENNKFSPENNLTRAQLAVLIQRAFNFNTSTVNTTNFTDVPANYWAYKEIMILKQYGFMVGRTNNHFAPDEFVTRAEIAALLTRILK